jgi:hypothetical protein
MLFKESDGDLFTEAGTFIKHIHCPKGRAALGLMTVNEAGQLTCGGCARQIHDIRRKAESEVVEIVTADPTACLLLDRRNLTLI